MPVTQSRAEVRATASARAARWFRQSGIQDESGGVSRYYRGDTDRRLPNSTEITGYAVKGLLDLGEGECAARAAEYLCGPGWNEPLAIHPFEIDDGGQWAYFFDSGIIARGLLAFWRYSGESRFLAAARRAGESMFRDFLAPEGYHPILRLPEKQPAPYSAWWSRNPGSFQLKAALAWRELFEATGEACYEEHYRRQLEFSLRAIDSLIRVETEPLRVMDRLHAYCYFLEGLLPDAQRNGRFLARGIGEVAGHLRRLAPRFARSDVFAQLLRVRILADRAGAVGLDEPQAAWEARVLAAYQIDSQDPTIDGAFAFGRRGTTMIPHANPVSTLFAAQALAWWESRPNVTWRDLL